MGVSADECCVKVMIPSQIMMQSQSVPSWGLAGKPEKDDAAEAVG
jgi:hypothetical protein